MDIKEIARLIADAERQIEKLDAEREKITAKLEELRQEESANASILPAAFRKKGEDGSSTSSKPVTCNS